MLPLAKLKQNLEFNRNLGELIEVMKLAATLQFNQFRSHKMPADNFSSLFETAFNLIPAQKLESIFLKPAQDRPQAIILISSDEGFLGELNSLLVNKLIEARREPDRIIVLGQQGADYLEELKVDFVDFASLGEKLEFKQAQELRDYILTGYLKREFSKVYLIYAHFVNITVQLVEVEILLPISGFSSVSLGLGHQPIIEPDLNSIIEGWVRLWLSFRLYQIFWSAKLAEFACRIMHLEASFQELGRINQHLKLEYFKHLHSLSDKTIREISAARLLNANLR